MKNIKMLLGTFCISFLFFLVSSLFLPFISKAYAENIVPVLRLSGADRYETSAAISREGWKTSEYIVLAAGEGDDKFADALAGSPLAYTLNAPLLLTTTNELSSSTSHEILRLKAKKAVLLGGTGVISEAVENQLKTMGLLVERLWGPDRYGTAVKIAEKVRETNPFSKVFLTTGEAFQYAMMISPYASRNGIPILFSEKDSLNLTTADAIKKLGPSEVHIIGNNDVLSQSAENSLKATGIKVNRVSGMTISETNMSIINTYKMGTDYLAAARDDIFADGLSGASFAALKNMPLILTGQTSANSSVSEFLNKCTLQCAYVFGGPGGISDYIITLIRKGNSNSAVLGNTVGNINSGGLAAVKDGWIFYHNAGQGGKLYKVKPDGTEKSEVACDVALNINIIGDWIYYTNLTEGSRIYKIRTDGTCRLRLNDDESWNTTVVDNWIYYINHSDGGHLYKIAIDGACRAEIIDKKSDYLNVQQDWIYCISRDKDHTIFRVKPQDTSIIQQLKNIFAWGINVNGSFIYFSNEEDNGSLYKINIDGTGLIKLCSDSVYDIQAEGELIYYSNASDSNKLYKVKTDGTGKTLIYDGSAYLLNIVGDWIYFLNDKEGTKLFKIKADGIFLEEASGSQLKDYIQETRKPQGETKADGGGIEWIDVIKPVLKEEGIPVKDAFSDDGKKVAFLTFDDGPSGNVTPEILDILKEYDIKGTFFVVGKMAKNNSEILKRISSEGHSIGNHSYSHEYSYLYSSGVNFMSEIRACDSVFKSILGEAFETKLFRFPGGAFGNSYSSYKTLLSEHGYAYINWNALSGDSEGNYVPEDALIKRVIATSAGKDHIVVLMHDLGSKSTTAKSLPAIIEYLKSQGYVFKKLL